MWCSASEMGITFFDSIGSEQVLETMRKGVPSGPITMAVQVHRAPRALMYQGETSSKIVVTGESVLQGRTTSTTIARSVVQRITDKAEAEDMGREEPDVAKFQRVDDITQKIVCRSRRDAVARSVSVGIAMVEAMKS